MTGREYYEAGKKRRASLIEEYCGHPETKRKPDIRKHPRTFTKKAYEASKG